MRSPTKLNYSIALLCVLLSALIAVPHTALGQQKIAIVVFDAQPIGVEEPTVLAASQLLRNDLAATGNFAVMDEGEVTRLLGEKPLCYDSQCALEIGQQLGVDKAVIGSLSRLGEKIIVELRLVDVNSGQVEFSDRMASATVEDLDTVIKRLATGLATGKPSEQTVEIGAITEVETREPRRRKNFFTVGGKIGYLFPTGDSWRGVDKLLCLDWVTRYETPTFMVESLVGWRYEIGRDEGAYDIPIEFSILYIPGKSDFSPYLGGGLGIHWVAAAREDEDVVYHGEERITNNGLALNVGGGLIGFRTYDFRIVVDLRYTMVFAKLDGQDTHQGVSLTFGVTSPRKDSRGCCIFNF
jgi:TolB-like protein